MISLKEIYSVIITTESPQIPNEVVRYSWSFTHIIDAVSDSQHKSVGLPLLLWLS